jgi:hypothetical protein
MRVLTVAFVVGTMFAAACAQPGMAVSVANETAGDLIDVGLKCRSKGAESLHALGTISQQQTKTGRIVFDAESYLYLVFRDGRGTLHNEQIQIYLENVHAPITLRVSDGYSVRCVGCSL